MSSLRGHSFIPKLSCIHIASYASHSHRMETYQGLRPTFLDITRLSSSTNSPKAFIGSHIFVFILVNTNIDNLHIHNLFKYTGLKVCFAHILLKSIVLCQMTC
jgi:hypothetical protein